MQIKETITLIIASLFMLAPSLAEDKKQSESKAQKPSLTYYYFDGWVFCSKITVIVNDEKKKHSSKINIKAIKVGEGNSSNELKKAKIASHGIIAKDKKGEILTTVEGHNYGKEKIKEVISLILNKKK